MADNEILDSGAEIASLQPTQAGNWLPITEAEGQLESESLGWVRLGRLSEIVGQERAKRFFDANPSRPRVRPTNKPKYFPLGH